MTLTGWAGQESLPSECAATSYQQLKEWPLHNLIARLNSSHPGLSQWPPFNTAAHTPARLLSMRVLAPLIQKRTCHSSRCLTEYQLLAQARQLLRHPVLQARH